MDEKKWVEDVEKTLAKAEALQFKNIAAFKECERLLDVSAEIAGNKEKIIDNDKAIIEGLKAEIVQLELVNEALTAELGWDKNKVKPKKIVLKTSDPSIRVLKAGYIN